MRDPYLYEDSDVLKNKLDIKTQDGLNDAEADYVVYRLKDLAMNRCLESMILNIFLRMHYCIFSGLI